MSYQLIPPVSRSKLPVPRFKIQQNSSSARGKTKGKGDEVRLCVDRIATLHTYYLSYLIYLIYLIYVCHVPVHSMCKLIATLLLTIRVTCFHVHLTPSKTTVTTEPVKITQVALPTKASNKEDLGRRFGWDTKVANVSDGMVTRWPLKETCRNISTLFHRWRFPSELKGREGSKGMIIKLCVCV